ncbi:hypothetical protein FHR70_004670 [Microvirga lupini]|uniref:Uncharacterized protein n=1 Tax=Microvirga lupini TaxID=420324 RepID=A0A7W4VQP8_9HYPH|nr:hypothetical protein [Microvirga lupini]MBB3021569.1 hypothetical protein [Microvirga lupini]
MRSTIVALFVVTSMAAAISVGTARAEETRSQHREWIRKLETPGGTFPYLLEIEAEPADSSPTTPRGTAPQHRSWLRKLETPGGTFNSSL